MNEMMRLQSQCQASRVLSSPPPRAWCWPGQNAWQQKSPRAEEGEGRKRRKLAMCLFSVCWRKGKHSV